MNQEKFSIVIILICCVFYNSCKSPAHQTHSASKNEYSLSKGGANDNLNNSTKSAEMKLIDSVTFNFGNIKPGDTVTHTFHFKNTGKIPLIISSATATCGCTVGHFNTRPIGLNQVDSITAVFASSHEMKGFQNKVITINYNSSQSPKLLTLYGRVN